ncbi:apolipoprotein N-acyltransferase [Noviherbaspirillum galbum]|uniref:Apolipoprotein N-acyltransferase n=1 Tax=Noviherbaspirillum galbum TaxID=2709383 RepID=A0A6B3SJ39_9BURK|nr:apolipoprotein N-acyltransferase [Noviherbaspirillum galbum]NEX60827.1 apolipoprotein N-acyltransferase [Noviherbaspirillum galbum]
MRRTDDPHLSALPVPTRPHPLSRWAPALAFLAGLANVFSFAPFGWWPLQILTLALTFHLASRAAPWRAGWTGFAYAFGWLAAGTHWLYVSMHDYGGMPAWMAGLAVVLLAMYLSLFYGLALGGATWLRRRTGASEAAMLMLAFPAAWLLAEWLRGWVLTGFPWISSGYAHANGPLGGFAPLAGVYGIGMIAAWAAASLVLVRAWKPAPLLAMVLIVAGGLLGRIDWTRPHGAPITVRLLQGNVPQEMKFAPEQIGNTLRLYHDMITERPADLIATPETAIPLLSGQLPPDYLPLFGEFANRSGSHVILGIPVSDGPSRYANSVIGLAPGDAGTPSYRFDKHHLVPFGEFIPFGFRWFVNMMNIPLGDFTPGAAVQPAFAVKDQRVLPNICYEDLFGEEIAAQLSASPVPATMLLNVSNIAWFGDTIALPQHLQISQMRSLETGRPMLRATNTGVTAVIGPKGEVQAMLRPYVRGAVEARVQGQEGLTPYSRFGNLPAVVLALVLLIASGLVSRRAAKE